MNISLCLIPIIFATLCITRISVTSLIRTSGEEWSLSAKTVMTPPIRLKKQVSHWQGSALKTSLFSLTLLLTATMSAAPMSRAESLTLLCLTSTMMMLRKLSPRLTCRSLLRKTRLSKNSLPQAVRKNSRPMCPSPLTFPNMKPESSILTQCLLMRAGFRARTG